MNFLAEVENNEQYGLITTSRKIADGLGKRHDHVLRDLDKISENPDLGCVIIPTTYKVKGQNREYREYLLTKDGFTLYMFNIQGYNDFKMAYINEFNRMEKILRGEELEPYKIEKKTYKSIPIMTVKDLEHMTGYDKSTINQYIRSKSLGTLLVGRSLSDIKYENKMFLGVTKSMNILYKKDVEKILNYLYKLDEYREFVDDYFKESAQSCSDVTLVTRLMSLKFLRNATLNFSSNEKMRKELDYIISKEYVKLGLLNEPTDDLNIDTPDGFDLFLKIGRWYESVK